MFTKFKINFQILILSAVKFRNQSKLPSQILVHWRINQSLAYSFGVNLESIKSSREIYTFINVDKGELIDKFSDTTRAGLPQKINAVVATFFYHSAIAKHTTMVAHRVSHQWKCIVAR